MMTAVPSVGRVSCYIYKSDVAQNCELVGWLVRWCIKICGRSPGYQLYIYKSDVAQNCELVGSLVYKNLVCYVCVKCTLRNRLVYSVIL